MQAPAHLGDGRRQNVNHHRIVRRLRLDLHRALIVDVEQHAFAPIQRRHDRRLGAAVAMLIDLRPFQKGVIGDHGVKIRPRHEMVVAPLMLAWRRFRVVAEMDRCRSE